MIEETNNSTGSDLCIWCCFPCLFLCLSIEKCFQSSFLCCCQILACECKTSASEKVGNKDMSNNQINKSNEHDCRGSKEDDFTEIVTSNESIRSTNKDLIVNLISEQIPEITDDEKKLLRTGSVASLDHAWLLLHIIYWRMEKNSQFLSFSIRYHQSILLVPTLPSSLPLAVRTVGSDCGIGATPFSPPSYNIP